MASTVLYPPLIDSYIPAFDKNKDCQINYLLSKASSSNIPIKGIHISVVKQNTGENVVNKEDDMDKGRYRATGIIITKPTSDNIFTILSSDIKNGWTQGWIYKVQIRVSSVDYDGITKQSDWLVQNASNFSEWSTYCIIKATTKPEIISPLFGNLNPSGNIFTIPTSSFEFNGTYFNNDASEKLYSYKFNLYEGTILLESSETIYTNQYYDTTKMQYLFKRKLINNNYYSIKIEYETINKYTDTLSFTIYVQETDIGKIDIQPVTIENIKNVSSTSFIFNSSISNENEEGRIAIKLYDPNNRIYDGDFIHIKRASSKDNFNEWFDIKTIIGNKKNINDYDIIYDYTAESGVWYQYGIQLEDSIGNKSSINIPFDAIIREYDYSYLLGENGLQLKLNLSNSVNNYSYTFSESKIDTIGGQFPIIVRNGNMKYRTFPLSGMISFNMDDQNTFITDKELYIYQDIADKYKEREKNNNFGYYNYKKEHDFREKVLDFLQDGKPKLFKSATEGNIIIRLMNITYSPNQTLNRMIGTFNSNAYEIATDNFENYIKYNFI